MAIGERIKRIRKLRKMTQKELGMAVGFDEKTADIRMAQYESETRNPKSELTRSLANELGVSPRALSVPDIDSNLGVMHTLFALEDLYGLTVDGVEGVVILRVNESAGEGAEELSRELTDWYNAKKRLYNGESTKEEYDFWRYNYPNTKKRVVHEAETSSPSRSVDDILAQLKANLDKLKNTQNEES